jgi:2-polyprenyl-6-methoxyphenol hydroxylase-like FAD-dependent oxidoreductase
MTTQDGSELASQVVIVGGGPVGMGLAIALGQRGIHCIVVERYRHPQPVPKGQNLTQRTMEHFYFWGAEPALRAARTIPRAYGIGGLTAYGSLLGEYAYDWLERELVRPYYFTDNERLPQYATEDVLRRRAAELPSVQILYEWTAEEVGQDECGGRVTIVSRNGGDPLILRADYVVGCDGARSTVRKQCAITQIRSDHDRLMVLLVFRSNGLHKLLERHPGKSFYKVLHPDLKGYWQFFGRVDLGTTWFFHAPAPPGTHKDNLDYRRLLYAAVGSEFDVAFDHIGFWELRFAVADTYRDGRIIIAGDAAHSHPPYGGYGVNTGFEDAVNLGWKLAAALQGWAGASLLDSYTEERQPVFASTARDFIEKAIREDREFLDAFNPDRDRVAFEHRWKERHTGARAEVNAFEPNYEGSPIVWGPPDAQCSAVGSHSMAARAGHHLAPQPLSSGRNVFQELGDGFTLLALDCDGGAPWAFQDVARKMRVPFKVIEDRRTDARVCYEASLVLVRPDQFVAWTSNDSRADAEAVLRKATGGASGCGRPNPSDA